VKINKLAQEVLKMIFNFSRSVKQKSICAGNTEGGSITVPLTSCLTGLD
jgi:hypothetical protein